MSRASRRMGPWGLAGSTAILTSPLLCTEVQAHMPGRGFDIVSIVSIGVGLWLVPVWRQMRVPADLFVCLFSPRDLKELQELEDSI